MVSKSRRPTYALILLALSVFFLCATFLPFLYSILFPNDDIQRVVFALENRGSPPLDADSVVQEAKDAAGLLTKVIPAGYYWGTSTQFDLKGSRSPQQVKAYQSTYIAWFQKRPRAMVMAITLYENEGGQKAYGISEGNPWALARGYGVPTLIFGVSLFLARKRKSSFVTEPGEPSGRFRG